MSTEVKQQFNACRMRFQQIQALTIAVQFAANHDAEFVVSDACTGLLTLFQLLMSDLDALEVAL